jgi:hypothetical protein
MPANEICGFLRLTSVAQVKYEVRSYKFIWASVNSCTHWLRPRNFPPLPPHFGPIYEGAIGQPI